MSRRLGDTLQTWLPTGLAFGAAGVALWHRNLFGVVLYVLFGLRLLYAAFECRTYARPARDAPRSARSSLAFWALLTVLAALYYAPYDEGPPEVLLLTAALVAATIVVRRPDFRRIAERLGIR